MNDEQEKNEIENVAIPADGPPPAPAPAPTDEPIADVPVVANLETADSSPAPTASPIESSSDSTPAPVTPLTPASNKRWYVVKVQSGREESIKNALERRVKIDALEEHVGRILIPTEKVTELSKGKRVVKKRKKFPGYLMCEVEFNDKILYLFRETSGVGDFVGGSLHKPPQPMSEREVERMLQETEEGGAKGGKQGGDEPMKKKVIISYGVKDKVKIRDGTFKDMEGEVKEITEPADPKENPKVKVELTIWGRPVDVEVEYWQVDPV